MKLNKLNPSPIINKNYVILRKPQIVYSKCKISLLSKYPHDYSKNWEEDSIWEMIWKLKYLNRGEIISSILVSEFKHLHLETILRTISNYWTLKRIIFDNSSIEDALFILKNNENFDKATTIIILMEEQLNFDQYIEIWNFKRSIQDTKRTVCLNKNQIRITRCLLS